METQPPKKIAIPPLPSSLLVPPVPSSLLVPPVPPVPSVPSIPPPMVLPTLYILTGTKRVHNWTIRVQMKSQHPDVCVVQREFGMQGGKLQTSQKTVTVCKKQNTVWDQAVAEAQEMWRKMQVKKGYVMDMEQLYPSTDPPVTPLTPIVKIPEIPLNDPLRPHLRSVKLMTAPSTELPIVVPKITVPQLQVAQAPQAQAPDNFVFYPMLAHKWIERGKRNAHLLFPCHAQPKLDGVRSTVHKTSDGRIVMKSRSDTECLFFHEIKADLARLDLPEGVYLDGELYTKMIPFSILNGYCNRKKMDGKTGFSAIPRPELESIHYHIFDCYFYHQPNKPFVERYAFLQRLLADQKFSYLNLVPTTVLQQEAELVPLHDQYVDMGYEGLILRNSQSPYKIRLRSNDLLKHKNFSDSEFTIMGATCPETGKEENCIIWILKSSKTDKTFTCRPRDETYEVRKTAWLDYQKNPNNYLGRQYTVRYQEIDENGIPRFPVGIGVRYDLV
jgi:hypothetical protein